MDQDPQCIKIAIMVIEGISKGFRQVPSDFGRFQMSLGYYLLVVPVAGEFTGPQDGNTGPEWKVNMLTREHMY